LGSAAAQSELKKRLHFLADLRAQPDFRTELWSQPEAEPKSEVTHCDGMDLFKKE